MIKGLINDMKTKYIYVICLVIYICILLGFCLYAHTSRDFSAGLKVNSTYFNMLDGICDGKYISKEDALKTFNKNVFYDKVSRKLIITSWNSVLKINEDDNSVIKTNNSEWYDIDDIASKLGYKTLFDSKNSNKYIYNYKEIEAKVRKIRTEVYDVNTNKVIGVLDNIKSIQILLDDLVNDNTSKYITVKVIENNDKIYVGKVEKTALIYEIQPIIVEDDNNEKISMTIIEGALNNTTNLNMVNSLAFDMFRINSESLVVQEEVNIKKDLSQNIYGIINNGYKQASFDTNVLSRIVHSDVNKENIISQIKSYSIYNNLDGVVVDFKKIKITDKELITQFIKEMAATLHGCEKKVILKMQNVSTYDIEIVKDFVDYVIVEAHSTRSVSSKVSGTHSSVNYVRELLQAFVDKADSGKIILEIAPYSILWTERAGTVIGAEVYSMDLCAKYIKENNINTRFDKSTGQNIINYTKGIITYRMWIEDITSISAKIDIAKNMDIVGTCIYKSGYESKDIYKVINFKEENNAR